MGFSKLNHWRCPRGEIKMICVMGGQKENPKLFKQEPKELKPLVVQSSLYYYYTVMEGY